MLGWNITVNLDTPVGFSKRGWREVTRRALALELRRWHRQIAYQHFLKGAAGKYKYKKRSRKYIERKRRKKPGQPDLVYSGDTQRAVVAGTPLIRAYPSRARLLINTPKYVQMRPYRARPDAPVLGREITAFTFRERRDAEVSFAGHCEKEFNKSSVKRTVKL